jgi:hypothetical protein
MKIKRFILFQIAIVIFAAMIGQLGKTKMPDCGIYNVRTIEQVYELEVVSSSILGDDFYDDFIEYQEDYIREIDGSPIVAIVKPTGNIRPYNYLFRHEVTVDEVIRGDNELEGKTIHIYDLPKFAVRESGNVMGRRIKHSGLLEYSDFSNIMQPKHTYLAFFLPTELNNYRQNDVYRFVDAFFCYFDLSYDGTTPITDLSNKVYFNDLKDKEFFTNSQRTLDAMMDIKRKIIEKYEVESDVGR